MKDTKHISILLFLSLQGEVLRAGRGRQNFTLESETRQSKGTARSTTTCCAANSVCLAIKTSMWRPGKDTRRVKAASVCTAESKQHKT